MPVYRASDVAVPSQRTSVIRTLALAAALCVLSWPTISLLWLGTSPSFPLVTIVLVLLLSAVVLLWDRVQIPSARLPSSRSGIRAAFAVVSAVLVLFALERWVGAMLSNAYRADMLIIIREATGRFLSGLNPYSTYFTYDAPWPTQLAYGPALWGPYLLPRLLHADLRVVTIAGELFVPACCGIAATVEGARGRVGSAVAWVIALAAVVMSMDVPQFTLMGHTPVYWPLFPLFAATVTRERWRTAAFALGILILARTTMVALVPVFLMAVWTHERSAVPSALALIAGTVVALLLPFIVWDPHALWDGMVTYYVRVMKQVVWVSSDGGARHTIGVTGWLLTHHWERFVEVVQVAMMAAICVPAWQRIRRGARPLPWMAASLLVFSMTTLWPVYYIYFDVLLLFISAAVAETLGARLHLRAWSITVVGVAIAVIATTYAGTQEYPTLAAESSRARQAFGPGFMGVERDGGEQFVWTKDDRVEIALPRRSVASADIIVRCRALPAAGAYPPLTKIALNGRPLWEGQMMDEWQTIRFPAPRSSWWIGFNKLELRFSLAASLPADARRLAVAVSRIDVVSR